MNIKVEVIDEVIKDIRISVVLDKPNVPVKYGNKLDIYVPNKTSAYEVIFLISSLLSQNSNQYLKVLDKENEILVTCTGVYIPEIEEVTIKLESSCEFISPFNGNNTIDNLNSQFLFSGPPVNNMIDIELV